MSPGKVLLCPLYSLSLFRCSFHFCFRSLVDTVYALKDEVQELRQVSHTSSSSFFFFNGKGHTMLKMKTVVHKQNNTERRDNLFFRIPADQTIGLLSI